VTVNQFVNEKAQSKYDTSRTELSRPTWERLRTEWLETIRQIHVNGWTSSSQTAAAAATNNDDTHTLSQKTRRQTFGHIFSKYWSIVIFSLAHSCWFVVLVGEWGTGRPVNLSGHPPLFCLIEQNSNVRRKILFTAIAQHSTEARKRLLSYRLPHCLSCSNFILIGQAAQRSAS